jgi:hypothetical protein
MSKLLKKRLLIILIPITFILISIASLNSKLNIKNYYELNTVVVNLLDKKVILNMDETIVNLEPFDMYVNKETIKNNSEKNYKILAEDNTLIEEFKAPQVAREEHILLKIISDKAEFCFVGLSVKDFFYSNTIPELTPESISQYESLENNILFKLLDDKSIYIFPGFDKLTKLPSIVNESDQVLGIYPIECELKTNIEEIKNIIHLFRNYNPEMQREYYKNKLDEINNLSL